MCVCECDKTYKSLQQSLFRLDDKPVNVYTLEKILSVELFRHIVSESLHSLVFRDRHISFRDYVQKNLVCVSVCMCVCASVIRHINHCNRAFSGWMTSQ